MSTERIRLGSTSPDRGVLRRYRRRTTVLIIVLALLAATLGVANALKGPELSSTAFDGAAAVSSPHARLVLTGDQSLTPVDENAVTITPGIPFHVESTGATVAITFDHALDYSTGYEISVAVTGERTGRAGTLTTTVGTPAATVYTLDRHLPATTLPDRIYSSRGAADMAGPTVVREAPSIQEYTESGSELVTLEIDETGAQHLRRIDPSTGTASDQPLGELIRVRKLQAADQGAIVGYIGDSPEGSADPVTGRLLLADLDAGGAPVAVTDAGGAPIRVADWRFVPGTRSVVVLDYDQQLLLVDPFSGAAPVPLGGFTSILDFQPGTTDLLVAGADGVTRLDLAQGERTGMTYPPLGLPTDSGSYPGMFIPLDGETYAQVLNEPVVVSGAARTRSQLAFVDATGTRVLLAPTSGRIGQVCSSPNHQLLAVTLVPDDAEFDRMTVSPMLLRTQVQLVDTRTGQAGEVLPGGHISWCGSNDPY